MSEKKSKAGIVPQEYSVKGHLRALENELTQYKHVGSKFGEFMRISTDEARTIRTRHNSIENRFNTIQEEVLRLEKKIDKLATGGLGFFGRLFWRNR